MPVTPVVVALALTGCEEPGRSPRPPVFTPTLPGPHAAAVQVDRVLDASGPVDVLWIVDDSSSMETELVDLADASGGFLAPLVEGSVDFHVGVVTTDMADPERSGKLRATASGARWIDAGTPDPEPALLELLDVGIEGSTDERGRDAAYLALVLEPVNAGFLRAGGSLHMIVVSDESDSSYQISKSEFGSWANGLRDRDASVTFSSFVMPPGGGALGYDGADYVDLTNLIGGTLHDIRVDATDAIAQLGEQAVDTSREYFLSQWPEVDTLSVSIVTAEGDTYALSSDDWTYDSARNSVTLVEVPPPGAEVELTYAVRDAITP